MPNLSGQLSGLIPDAKLSYCVNTKLTLQKEYNRVLSTQTCPATYWICTACTTCFSTPTEHHLPSTSARVLRRVLQNSKSVSFYRCNQNSYEVMIVKTFEAEDKAKPNTVIPRIRGLNMAAVSTATVQATRLLTGHKPVNTYTQSGLSET
jgi:hypothetical protein